MLTVFIQLSSRKKNWGFQRNNAQLLQGLRPLFTSKNSTTQNSLNYF